MKPDISDRLKKIAEFVSDGERVADIGTDHGLLALFLKERDASIKMILSDVRIGPLEKARRNIAKHSCIEAFDIRMADGLQALRPGEADTVVIAGMGGSLIIDILMHDTAHSNSFKKFIFQPRRDSVKLRQWLAENGFAIIDEALVREGKYICEIIVSAPLQLAKASEEYDQDDFEFSPILIQRSEPLWNAFLSAKIAAEKKALVKIEKASASAKLTEAGKYRREVIRGHIDKMYGMMMKPDEADRAASDEVSQKGGSNDDQHQ